jgi:C_GCAxxG_C_C family probable redox protein
VSESKDIKSKLIPKIATGFCGGVSHTDGICGAISGGILAINMINSRSQTSYPCEENKLKVQKLITSFNNKFDSTQCYKLTGCDLGTEKGESDYNSKNKKKLCDDFVSEATQLTLDLIDD